MSAASERAYSRTGRPGVPPERLLKALLLTAPYSARSERPLCERIDTDLLFRWFLDRQPGDAALDPTTFAHNRERPDAHGRTTAFFAAVVGEAVTAGLCSEHFTADGTLIQSFAAAKSFQPIPANGGAGAGGPSKPPEGVSGFPPRNVEADFHGQKRSNETHRRRTDPEARLYRKGLGKEARLSHMGHALGANRRGLIPAAAATAATGTAEREAARARVDGVIAAGGPATPHARGGRGVRRRPVPARPGGTADRAARAAGRGAAGAGRRPTPAAAAGVEARQRMKARQEGGGYRPSQKCRKKIEEGFGWPKAIAGMGRSRVVGRWKRRQLMEVGAAAYNLVRPRTPKPA